MILITFYHDGNVLTSTEDIAAIDFLPMPAAMFYLGPNGVNYIAHTGYPDTFNALTFFREENSDIYATYMKLARYKKWIRGDNLWFTDIHMIHNIVESVGNHYVNLRTQLFNLSTDTD